MRRWWRRMRRSRDEIEHGVVAALRERLRDDMDYAQRRTGLAWRLNACRLEMAQIADEIARIEFHQQLEREESWRDLATKGRMRGEAGEPNARQHKAPILFFGTGAEKRKP